MPNTPSLDDQPESVQLGRHVYELVPQPLPYLKRHLGRAFADLTAGDVDIENVGAFITGRAYDVLKVFIPDLMPLHEWEGYASQAAMEGDLWDDDTARRLAPNGPQTKLALTVAFKVNGLDAYKTLGKLVDPTMLRAVVTKLLADSVQSRSQSASSALAPTPSTTSSLPASPTEASTGSSSSTPEDEDWIVSDPQVASASSG